MALTFGTRGCILDFIISFFCLLLSATLKCNHKAKTTLELCVCVKTLSDSHYWDSWFVGHVHHCALEWFLIHTFPSVNTATRCHNVCNSIR